MPEGSVYFEMRAVSCNNLCERQGLLVSLSDIHNWSVPFKLVQSEPFLAIWRVHPRLDALSQFCERFLNPILLSHVSSAQVYLFHQKR